MQINMPSALTGLSVTTIIGLVSTIFLFLAGSVAIVAYSDKLPDGTK